jgi:hypothetical protein
VKDEVQGGAVSDSRSWLARGRTRIRIQLWDWRERRRREADADLAERNELAEKGIKRELRRGMGGL